MRGLARDGARGTYRYEYVIGVDLRGSIKSTSVADVNLQNRQWPKNDVSWSFHACTCACMLSFKSPFFRWKRGLKRLSEKKFAPAAQQKLELGIYIYNIQPEPRVRATGGMPTVMFTIGVKPDLRRTIYAEQNPNTAKNHPLRLSEQSHSRLLYGERRPSHIGRWPNKGSIHPDY